LEKIKDFETAKDATPTTAVTAGKYHRNIRNLHAGHRMAFRNLTSHFNGRRAWTDNTQITDPVMTFILSEVWGATG